MVGKTRVVSNKLGYISHGERCGFMPDFVISINGMYLTRALTLLTHPTTHTPATVKGHTTAWSDNPNGKTPTQLIQSSKKHPRKKRNM